MTETRKPTTSRVVSYAVAGSYLGVLTLLRVDDQTARSNCCVD
jgi:hypothetical protein